MVSNQPSASGLSSCQKSDHFVCGKNNPNLSTATPHPCQPHVDLARAVPPEFRTDVGLTLRPSGVCAAGAAWIPGRGRGHSDGVATAGRSTGQL